MIEIPGELLYTEEHEWVQIENDEATVGITDYAQEQLGDVVFVELPEVGRVVAQKEEVGTIESVKAASELYSPVSGEVIAINGSLDNTPEFLNKEPYSDGWLFRVKLSDPGEEDSLLKAEDYKNHIEVP